MLSRNSVMCLIRLYLAKNISLKTHFNNILFVAAATVQLGSASWIEASAFSCPSNIKNHCNSQQSVGFDWGGLDIGPFSTYSGFYFNRWSCASSFVEDTKHDFLGSFQEKCIIGEASTEPAKCPTFGGASSNNITFSVDTVQVTTEFDCDLEFHYSMPGGITCKQKAFCQSAGTIVHNTQCGGAQNVTVVYPAQTTGSGVGRSSCTIGIHSVGFYCYSSLINSPPASKITPSLSFSTFSRATDSSSVSSDKFSLSSPPYLPSSSDFSIYISSTSVSGYKSHLNNSVTPSSNSSIYVASSSSSLDLSNSSDAALTSSIPLDTIITEVIVATTTVCPFTSTRTTGGETSVEVGITTSNILITSTKILCTKCSLAPTPAACPDLLPQCLNTWIFFEGCSTNTDTSCFCPSAAFVQHIFECLSAYGASYNEISSAQIYFQGICAPYIPQNPAFVVFPSTISAQLTLIPVTTIQVYTTVIIPYSESGSVIPWGSTTSLLSTVMTVPQVRFHTESSSVVQLIAGTPTSTASTTSARTKIHASPTLNSTLSLLNSTLNSAFNGSPNSAPATQTANPGNRNGIAFSNITIGILLTVLARRAPLN